ncbi:MAG: trypsin-like peptidase domain-containing protein [Chloroflexi bacterium]|nr:trypsin-like peptidase domain-containing protein [Chloroflexota bacterium]
MRTSKKSLVMLGLSVLFSLSCGLSSLLDTNPDAGSNAASAPTAVVKTAPPQASAPTPVPVVGLDSEENVLVNLFERVSPSVVYITVLGVSNNATAEASGSGFVLDTDGHIVTNNHVIDGASKIRVKFSNDDDFEAKVVGADADTDLAVIQVKAPAELLKAVTLGDSDSLKVGQRVVAIGNPFGFERAMSVGFISAVGRIVQLSDTGFSLPELIQTDAAINPGNSGGPLLNMKGQVIGVTNLIFSRSGVNSGVGLAIPVETVKRVAPVLIKDGRYAHSWLGISGQSINSDLAEQLSLPTQHGALVTDVTSGSPAAKAGLVGGSRRANFNGRPIQTGGDIITAIEGKEVRSFDDVIAYLAKNTTVGQQVELTIIRNGSAQKIKVTLAARPTNR